MVVFAHGPALNRFTVHHVIPGSPASEAGLQVGDEIKKVGIWPVRWFNLAQVNKKFSGREGKKMRLTYERNGIRNKATFILRNLLASD
jgi:C-terminal processing protease CtpA/Prc